MADTRPFLVPVYVEVGGIAYSGTYTREGDVLTVHYGGDKMAVELGVGLPTSRAQQILAALVKRARKLR